MVKAEVGRTYICKPIMRLTNQSAVLNVHGNNTAVVCWKVDQRDHPIIHERGTALFVYSVILVHLFFRIGF